MFDFRFYFDEYCQEHSLDLCLSFDMPCGYETANGMFDIASKTVFLNAERLRSVPDYEKAFFLFHELRHASQYLYPGQFSDMICRSLQYVIAYDGTCYKRICGHYYSCKLDASKYDFTTLYLGQPHEVDANAFAYKQTKRLYGDSKELNALFDFWMPRQTIPIDTYNTVFLQIDQKISCSSSLEETT